MTTYYDTIEEDLARAREILAKRQPTEWEKANFPPNVIEALRRAAEHKDIYDAHKLLESFVAEIERLREAVKHEHD
jgi:hypothetical protein